MGSTKSSGSDKRVRNWAFVLYPESCLKNWRDQLDELHIAWVASPLHDADVNSDGEAKKPHWHIILTFEGVKAYDQIVEITAAVGGTIPQRCESLRGYVRYLIHLDNPDKHQYPRDEIECHGGFDASDHLTDAQQDKYNAIAAMIEWCAETDCVEYEDLLIYAMHNEPVWFRALCDCATYTLTAYLKSRRHRKQRSEVDYVD